MGTPPRRLVLPTDRTSSACIMISILRASTCSNRQLMPTPHTRLLMFRLCQEDTQLTAWAFQTQRERRPCTNSSRRVTSSCHLKAVLETRFAAFILKVGTLACWRARYPVPPSPDDTQLYSGTVARLYVLHNPAVAVLARLFPALPLSAATHSATGLNDQDAFRPPPSMHLIVHNPHQLISRRLSPRTCSVMY